MIEKNTIELVLKELKNKGKNSTHFKIELLSSLTNLVYKIETKSGLPLIYREINTETALDFFIDHGKENQILSKLMSMKKYPIIYYCENNVRIEEYFYGLPLSLAEFRFQNEFHEFIIRSSIDLRLTLDPPVGDQPPKIIKFLENQILWDMCFDGITKSNFNETEKTFYLSVLTEFASFRAYFIDKLKQIPSSHCTACHNDINIGNILYNEEKKEYLLLDYEYADYNLLEFEIGNFFCEIEMEYLDVEPYVIFRNSALKNENSPWRLEDQKVFIEKYEKIFKEKTGMEIKILIEDVLLLKLLSHMFWIVLVIATSLKSMKLNLTQYCMDRYKIYMKEKYEIFEVLKQLPTLTEIIFFFLIVKCKEICLRA